MPKLKKKLQKFMELLYLLSLNSSMRREIIPYRSKLKEYARALRNNSTKSEIRLWRYLKGTQRLGYDFHRQKPIDNYIADFYCSELKLVIELDGITHIFEGAKERDRIRTKRLNELGITVIRFDDAFVFKNIDFVLEEIDEMIVKLARESSVS